MKKSAISCEDVDKRFDDTVAVRGLSFDLQPGELLSLLGPSGCGKTTALRLIAGFETPDSGRIFVGGTEVAGPKTNLPPERRRVGMVFQDYALFPHMSLRENVAYALNGNSDDRVAELLGLVGLDGLDERMPHELSGGEQQRGALARSLASEPQAILLDEPFSNLDAALRAHVRAEVRGILRAAGATAVFVTHDIEEALSLTDRVAVMFDGRIEQIATPRDLYRQPATRRIAEWLGDANFLPGRVDGSRVECELGRLPSDQAINGPVDVMVRPDWLTIATAEPGTGAVVDRIFYGHDQLIRVALDSGTTVQVRVLSDDEFLPGQRVTVGCQGPNVVFRPGPADDADSR